MQFQYLRNFWRILRAGKMYSIINISGLAVGMTGFLLLAIWLIDQLSFDKFHQNYERIAKVMQHQRLANGNVQTFESSPVLLAEEVKQNFRKVAVGAHVLLVNSLLDLSGYGQLFFHEGITCEPNKYIEI